MTICSSYGVWHRDPAKRLYPCGAAADVIENNTGDALCADHAHEIYPDIERGVEAVPGLTLIPGR